MTSRLLTSRSAHQLSRLADGRVVRPSSDYICVSLTTLVESQLSIARNAIHNHASLTSKARGSHASFSSVTSSEYDYRVQ